MEREKSYERKRQTCEAKSETSSIYIYIYESEWTKSTTSTISFAHIKSSHINASLLRFLAYSTWANVLCARVRLFIENFTKMALFCEQNKYTERESERGRETIYLSLWCIFHFAVWLRISLTHHLFLIIIIVAHFFSSFYFFHIYILLVELVAIVLYLRLYLYCFRTNHSISRKRPRRNGKKSGKNKNFAFVCACACVVVCKYII